MLLPSDMVKHKKRILLLIFLVVSGVLVLNITGVDEKLTLANIQEVAEYLEKQVNTHYILSVFIFIGVYVIVNLWLPAAAILTLLAGFLFGVIMGTVYVLTAAITGALLSFTISRNFAGEWIQHRWQQQLEGFNREVSKRGYYYLIIVRMIPMMPFMLINFFAGLTKIHLKTFLWTTAAGSLPGILVFTYAGRQLLTIKSVDEIFTPRVIVAFVLLGVFITVIAIIRYIMNKTKGED